MGLKLNVALFLLRWTQGTSFLTRRGGGRGVKRPGVSPWSHRVAADSSITLRGGASIINKWPPVEGMMDSLTNKWRWNGTPGDTYAHARAHASYKLKYYQWNMGKCTLKSSWIDARKLQMTFFSALIFFLAKCSGTHSTYCLSHGWPSPAVRNSRGAEWVFFLGWERIHPGVKGCRVWSDF